MDSKHTRYPVARQTLDNVIGILPAKDLLTARLAGQPIDFIKMVEPPLFIPDSTTALNALDGLRKTEVGAALVIDEYGGLLGMITLHDVLSAIAGFLPAIGADGLPDVVRRDDGSLLLDGLLSIDTVRELLDVQEFPEEARVGFQTLGGFIMSQLGIIPVAGQSFEWGLWRFEVLDMDERRVDKVLIAPLPAPADVPASNGKNAATKSTPGQTA
jgi:putative hemolysin